ncbi:hypothetical protein [Falsiroseomonas sp. E2-1-a20]|uniref:hypothetical protein n=1 Tax=Falsiroseomonas sp. E2-1-a20 TaxID=3239300 RepID=UPI003F2DA203
MVQATSYSQSCAPAVCRAARGEHGDADIGLGGPVRLSGADDVQPGVELLRIPAGGAIAEHQYGGGRRAGVADGALHDQAARPAWQRHGAGDVPDPGWDHREFLACARAIEGRLDGGAIIGHAVAEPTEVVGQHGLAVAQVLRKVALVEVGVEDQQVVNACRHFSRISDQSAVAVIGPAKAETFLSPPP